MDDPKKKQQATAVAPLTPAEIWKDIVGYEGLYEVSNLGNVKSLSKVKYTRGGSFCITKERMLIPTLHMNGYYTVTLTFEKKFKSIEIHRIIAKAFIPNPENKKCVNHLNKIRTDNRIENLEWTTYRENSSHGLIGRKKYSKYVGVSYNKNSKKWISQCFIDKKLIHLGSTFSTEREAALCYNNKLIEMNITNNYINVIEDE